MNNFLQFALAVTLLFGVIPALMMAASALSAYADKNRGNRS